MEAADSTAVSECEAIDLVARLVDQSLVVVAEKTAEEPRYRMLEPVRQYVWERLKVAGEQTAALRRHRDFFLGLTQEWGKRFFYPERTDRVTADSESFRAALGSWQEGDVEGSLHLVAAMWINWFFGNQTGAREWLERVIDGTRHVAHPCRAEVLSALAAFIDDDPGRQQGLLDEAVELARRLESQHGLAGP
jgi:predicted ATPase